MWWKTCTANQLCQHRSVDTCLSRELYLGVQECEARQIYNISCVQYREIKKGNIISLEKGWRWHLRILKYAFKTLKFSASSVQRPKLVATVFNCCGKEEAGALMAWDVGVKSAPRLNLFGFWWLRERFYWGRYSRSLRTGGRCNSSFLCRFRYLKKGFFYVTLNGNEVSLERVEKFSHFLVSVITFLKTFIKSLTPSGEWKCV